MVATLSHGNSPLSLTWWIKVFNLKSAKRLFFQGNGE
jgi:hypothetical protein